MTRTKKLLAWIVAIAMSHTAGLQAAQAAGALVLEIGGRAVVAGEDHQGVVGDAEFAQAI